MNLKCLSMIPPNKILKPTTNMLMVGYYILSGLKVIKLLDGDYTPLMILEMFNKPLLVMVYPSMLCILILNI